MTEHDDIVRRLHEDGASYRAGLAGHELDWVRP